MGDDNLSPRVPHVYSAVRTFPSLTMRNGERALTSPERRKDHRKTILVKLEVLVLEALDSVVEHTLTKKSMRGDASLERRTRNAGPRLGHRTPREPHQKITYPKDVHCSPWNL